MSTQILIQDSILPLVWPEDISDKYNLNELDRLKLNQLINVFKGSVYAQSTDESLSQLSQAFSILGSVETFSVEKYLTVTGSLEKWEVEDYDCYFDVKRKQTHGSPIFLMVQSLLIAYKIFLNMKNFPKDNPDHALVIWKKYHWIFFVFLQANILCMLHLKKEMRKENIIQAGAMLKSMSQLMLASGASMLFAGQFQRQAYEDTVRPSMMPPYVKSSDFSGIMSYDHAYLIYLWSKEKKMFKLIPSFLNSVYEQFLESHQFLALAHKFVCHKYGGDQEGSLREKKVTALENLEKINNSRRRLIINNESQLLPSDISLELKSESDCQRYIKIGFQCYSQLLLKSFN